MSEENKENTSVKEEVEEPKIIDETKVEEAPPEGLPEPKKSKGIPTKTLIILVAVAVVLVGALGAMAYKNFKDNKTVQVVASVTPSAVPSLDVKTATATPDRVIDDGVTWISPQKLDDQGLFEKVTADSAYDSADYYKVGTTSTGGDIILATVNLNEMTGGYLPIHRFIKNGDSYKRIVQNSADFGSEGYSITKKTTNDESYVFKSLISDKVISKDQTDLISVQSPRFTLTTDPNATQKKIASTKWGDLILETSKSYSTNDINKDSLDKTTIVKVARYFIKLNDSSETTYDVRPKFLRDDNTFDLDYKISKVQSEQYDKFDMGGCGFGLGAFPLMADADSLKNNQLVGTKDGSSVYTITDPSNKTLNYAYMLYKSDQAANKISSDDFAQSYGFVYWIDAYGSTIGYLRSDYKPAMECGKPVVYLYPTKTTNFSVRVGANVTESDPLYQGIWKGIANPDGSLVVDGKTYPNLFWEGKGIGEYPKVDFGKVIPSSQVQEVITADLKSMSLNNQEISDFLAFWLDKMPQTPYTRLSWLTNNELDKLAPLSINPKPDSVIRVFLDFSGLNTKAQINSQVLPQFKRSGFTAVEWGGLLKGM